MLFSNSTARLLSALLDVSQLEAGAIKPNFESFPIDDILTRIWREFAPLANQKGLEFRMVPSSIYVWSDPTLLERILGNFYVKCNSLHTNRQYLNGGT